MKQSVIQFVFVKPIMAICTLTILVYHGEEVHWWSATEMTIYNISYTIALYGLVRPCRACTLIVCVWSCQLLCGCTASETVVAA